MTGSSLTLGTAGSRRTVYLIDDNPKLSDNSEAAESPSAATSQLNTTGDSAPSTVLMYNRISNVIGTIGADASGSVPADPATDKEKKKRNDERENAVWYEYGCV